MFRRFTPLVAPLAAVVALTSCASGGQPQSGSTDTQTPEGPLDKYFAAVWDGQEWTQDDYDAQHRRREELIAQCMAKEGFEYVPDIANGPTVMSDDDFDGPDWNSLEFAQQYGFGAIDWPGREESDMVTDEDEWVDPNADYVASLSESETEAFYEVLYGPFIEESTDEEDDFQEYRWEDNGCYGWADNEINSEDPTAQAWEDPEFEDLFNAMNEMWELSLNSPEASALDKEWSDCMTAAGYPGFAARDDAPNSIYDMQNALYEEANSGEEWVEPSPQALEEIRLQEIALATASWKCSDELNLTKRQQEIDLQMQQQFVDEHQAELDAFVAKYQQKKNG